jgi:flagellar P-ring protein precursor FlgI
MNSTWLTSGITLSTNRSWRSARFADTRSSWGQTTLGLMAVLLLGPGLAGAPARIKELVAVEGVRDNQLLGYGLVVGLAGTGDRRQAVFPGQSLANLLERMGVSVPPTAFQVRNTAAVLVTAVLPPFAQPGGRIDVTAAAIGDAQNLQGGLLIMAPLRGGDGQVYAVAQGPVVTGGFVAGRGGNSQLVNHPTVGRIPNGALVEKPAPSLQASGGEIRLQLKSSDFTTASRIADAINRSWGERLARAEHAGLVVVTLSEEHRKSPVEFMARLEGLPVERDDSKRIIVNERTGTIVLGKDVLIRPVAILHGALSVEIDTAPVVSQPEPLSTGQTVVTAKPNVNSKEEKAKVINLKAGASVEDLVKALQVIGATPRDVIAILQNLRAAGALDATLEVI